MDSKGIGTVYRGKLAAVILASKGVITPNAAATTLEVPQQEAARILSRCCAQGWLKRVKRGVYIPIATENITGDTSIEEPWILADHLYAPGYLAGFSAIKYWDLSEQIFETTTFFTTTKIQNCNSLIGRTRFRLKHIPHHKLFGTKVVWNNNVKLLVSDATKTMVDLFDNPQIVGGMRIVKDIFTEYHASKFFDLDKLIEYSNRMNNKTIFKRIGFLMEIMGLEDLVEGCGLKNRISKGYSVFDTGLKNTKCVSRWNLKVPEVWVTKND
ncbi:MAG: hypothetical protein V4490_07965 [Pseudomonadota bacterium]